MSKYVKLAALEKLAKPMDEIHKEEGYAEDNSMSEGEHSKCECPCCGAPCESCNEAEMEDSEEDTMEDESEDEDEGE